MKTEKETVVIKTYQRELAKTVADMWNKSRDGWGGHAEVRTEEQVLSQEENSTNMKTFIAMDGEEAVGYCGLSQYREDEGALYIPLLNVRTDYHGKKIGKKLVLTALEETIKEGWPRLDLNTWPGNTKAVPLYKKCGFFWENRDDSVHLMNFLPTVLTAPVFEDFFQEADWYRDNVREVKIEPDGLKHGDFEMYEYKWQHGLRFLDVAIEKSSRGICAVKNEQYSVRMELDHHKLIFGKSYPVRVYVENHTSEPLTIEIRGRQHRNVTCRMEIDADVKDVKCFEGSFTVATTDEEQSNKKTHPSVTASVVINGKELTMKTGILPMIPVKWNGKVDGLFSIENKQETVYLELENNCPSPAIVSFQLPQSAAVQFEKTNCRIPLKEKEKLTLPLSCLVSEGSFYKESVEITVLPEGGEEITYTQELSFPFTTLGRKLYGECRDYYHLFAGITHVALKKETNALLYERGRLNKSDYWFFYPKLGKPFSEEFSIMKPESVAFYEESGKVGMKLSYPSRDFAHVYLHRIVELTGDGLMSQHYEIENKGNAVVDDIHLNFQLSYPFSNVYLPYDRDVVFSEGTYNHEVGVWDEKKLSENWLFTEKNGKTAALIWKEDLPVHFHHWHIQYFEESWEAVPAKSSIASGKLWFGENIFTCLEELRAFSQGVNVPIKKPTPAKTLVFESVDGGFMAQGEEALVRFRSNVNRSTEGNLTMEVGGKPVKTLLSKDGDTPAKWEVQIPLKEDGNVVPVYLKGSLSSQHVEKRLLLFKLLKDEVDIVVSEEQGHTVYTLSNGAFTIKAAPSFYPGFYSLTDGETEWLDTSFPQAGLKSWWNPWVGGITFGLEKLIQRKIITLPSVAKFMSVYDQFNNEWTGIRLTTTVTEHETYGGLVYHQYAVTRPGMAALAVFSQIDQETGFHFYGVTEHLMFNLSPGETIGDLSVSVEKNETNVYQHHEHESHVYELSGSMFEQKGANNKLHFIPNGQIKDMEVYMNRDVVLSGTEELRYTKAGDKELSEPHFFVLSKEAYELENFNELRSLRFSLDRKEG